MKDGEKTFYYATRRGIDLLSVGLQTEGGTAQASTQSQLLTLDTSITISTDKLLTATPTGLDRIGGGDENNPLQGNCSSLKTDLST